MPKSRYTTYWANTSSNSLVGKILREGDRKIKEKFEILLRGESIRSEIDEQIVYNQLDGNERAVWSLLLASGYLKVLSFESYRDIPEGTNPKKDHAVILEFKVRNKRRESSLEETVQDAITQIEEKQYAAELMSRGIPKEHIFSYGFAFEGKNVLIEKS